MTVMDEIAKPLANGKDAEGKFVKGHKLAKGNPHNKTLQRNRAYMLSLVKPEYLKRAFLALVDKAASGDVAACRELFDRTIGKVVDEQDKDERTKLVRMFLVNISTPEQARPVTARIVAEQRSEQREDSAQEHTDDAQSATETDER